MTKDTIRQLLKETVRQIVNESMNVYIKGANYKRTDDLHSLAYHLIDKCLSPVVNNLPSDQVQYFKKNGVQYYETIVPDGSFYSGEGGGTGILNFYISGLTTQSLKEVLKSIFQELRKLKIHWGKIKKEKSGMYKSEVIRIPIKRNDGKYTGPPELNLANRNAYHIFHNILQFEGTDSFHMTAQELKDRIESLQNDKDWVKSNQIKPTDTKIDPKDQDTTGDEWKQDSNQEDPDENPYDKLAKDISSNLGGARFISGGYDENTIWSRLKQIWEIADWAIKNGYNQIYVS